MQNSTYVKDSKEYASDLERYKLVVDYFEENPDKISMNINYLEDVHRELIKSFPGKVDISDDNIQDKVRMICSYRESVELGTRLRGILMKNLDGKLGMISNHMIREENWLLGRVPENKSNDRRGLL